jgi:Sulfotransferase family
MSQNRGKISCFLFFFGLPLMIFMDVPSFLVHMVRVKSQFSTNLQKAELRDQAVLVKEAANNQAEVSTSITTAVPTVDNLLVQQGDSIYVLPEWDAAPIVLEQYKLVFFTIPKVGCTAWKQLFRRMMGYRDWKNENVHDMQPWNPESNGLKYLYHYDRVTASTMMTSPEWTRAIIVRDPKERFLSAYLDKIVRAIVCPNTA